MNIKAHQKSKIVCKDKKSRKNRNQLASEVALTGAEPLATVITQSIGRIVMFLIGDIEIKQILQNKVC